MFDGMSEINRAVEMLFEFQKAVSDSPREMDSPGSVHVGFDDSEGSRYVSVHAELDCVLCEVEWVWDGSSFFWAEDVALSLIREMADTENSDGDSVWSAYFSTWFKEFESRLRVAATRELIQDKIRKARDGYNRAVAKKHTKNIWFFTGVIEALEWVLECSEKPLFEEYK